MEENLEKMVTNYDPKNFTESDQEQQQPQNVEQPNVTEEVSQQENESQMTIQITNFVNWFRENVSNFDNVFSVNATLRGVDSDKNLIITAKDPIDPSGETRYPYVFRGADTIPVLNLPGQQMFVFPNNTFQVNYLLNNDILVKSYNLRTGMVVVFCYVEKTNNYYVPVYVSKLTRRNMSGSINVPNVDTNRVDSLLQQQADVEAAATRYKQLRKHMTEISTNMDLVKFFNDRESKIQDVNHLIQIDTILASVFGPQEQ